MRRTAAAALALSLLAGCSGDDEGAAASRPPTTSSPAPVACPPLRTPPGDAEVASAAGDFDGDARPDRLVTYRVDPGGPWRVRMELAAGGGAESELPAAAEAVRALGGARLDVGPAEAAFAVVGQSAAGPNLGLFVLRACRVERVALGGRPAAFPVGTGAAARAGLACQVPGLVAYEATTTDSRSYQASTVGYLLVGVILDEANRSRSTLRPDDPALAGYGAFSCGPIRL